MRLIDADSLIEGLKAHFDALYREDGELLQSDHICTAEDCDDLIDFVKSIPTAYDVEKVVNRMERNIKETEECYWMNYDDKFVTASTMDLAIEYVKEGYVNGTT